MPSDRPDRPGTPTRLRRSRRAQAQHTRTFARLRVPRRPVVALRASIFSAGRTPRPAAAAASAPLERQTTASATACESFSAPPLFRSVRSPKESFTAAAPTASAHRKTCARTRESPLHEEQAGTPAARSSRREHDAVPNCARRRPQAPSARAALKAGCRPSPRPATSAPPSPCRLLAHAQNPLLAAMQKPCCAARREARRTAPSGHPNRRFSWCARRTGRRSCATRRRCPGHPDYWRRRCCPRRMADRGAAGGCSKNARPA